MEEQIETRVTPKEVWASWEKAHLARNKGGIEQGKTGKNEFQYEIIDVKQGESFSMLWKSLFVRLVFSQSVKPIQRGSQISYRVQIKGPFAWPIRWLLGKKIRKNVHLVLKSIVQELENKRVG